MRAACLLALMAMPVSASAQDAQRVYATARTAHVVSWLGPPVALAGTFGMLGVAKNSDAVGRVVLSVVAVVIGTMAVGAASPLMAWSAARGARGLALEQVHVPTWAMGGSIGGAVVQVAGAGFLVVAGNTENDNLESAFLKVGLAGCLAGPALAYGFGSIQWLQNGAARRNAALPKNGGWPDPWEPVGRRLQFPLLQVGTRW